MSLSWKWFWSQLCNYIILILRTSGSSDILLSQIYLLKKLHYDSIWNNFINHLNFLVFYFNKIPFRSLKGILSLKYVAIKSQWKFTTNLGSKYKFFSKWLILLHIWSASAVFIYFPTKWRKGGGRFLSSRRCGIGSDVEVLGLSNHQALGPGKSEVPFSSLDGGNWLLA